jgi:serine/threonine protein kinase
MTDEERTKDPVPSQVGDGSRRFVILKNEHLGSGHFGDVYAAVHYKTRQKVAVKLEHRSGSIARREWEVLRALEGDGAPVVYYTGTHGRYYVLVMDLLGPTLQRLLESRQSRRLPWDIVSVIGSKCVDLLRKLHAKGYVHGDVKPENFLCAYSEEGAMDPNDGMFVVDLGLASRWRDVSRANGHIAYGQRVDHFSGTVRYASVNAHLGRWLSRRDDLESLGYMLLYLFSGSLPWQGYCGDDKNMQVCETKGRLTVDAMCRGAPEVLQYFLAYVRGMKFDETPDYDYLLLLCSEGNKGIREVRRLLALEEKDKIPDGDADIDGPGNAGLVPGPTATVGQKRKQRDSDGEGAIADASAKRFKVVIPRRVKTHQWIIVSTSSRTGTSPHTQCYTSHTSYANLVKEVEKKWGQGMRITSLNFAGNMWTAVLSARNSGYSEQALHYCQDSDFPRDWTRTKWENAYFITSVAGNDNCWGVVCSTMQRGRKYKQQSYIGKCCSFSFDVFRFPFVSFLPQESDCQFWISCFHPPGPLS